MVTITKNNRTVSRSKNLRGILSYASKHGIAAMGVAKHLSNIGATLHITFEDGARVATEFADYNVLIRWLGERRSWPTQYRNW